ncbi:translation initiation factor eIF-2B subunit gamma [Kwoniella heveanensis CBS 569]|nr:translation initiation factor eIF-2B subunit gamma [Kwoniella heveanensis CBS 569]
MSTSVIFDQRPGVSKRRPVDNQDFMAVILVGYGDNLYPFNQGTNVVSKAMLPIGNVPIINSVVDWVLVSGLRDILIIVPPPFYTSVAEHISEHYSMATHPKARIEIRRTTEGEKEDDEEQSENTHRASSGLVQREGTARLLRRFKNWIRTDFVLLPCDLSPPVSLPLTSILDRHRSSPDAVLTSVFYEPTESVKDGEEKILVAMDKETDELLLIQPLEGMEDDLELRSALINSHPTLSLTTRLSDAHIYVLRRTVLDLLSTRRSKDLDSMREQVIPWLIKGGWQKGLGRRWAPILNPPQKDPFAAALARSTTSDPASSAFSTISPESSPHFSHVPLPSSKNPRSASASTESNGSNSMQNSMLIDPEEPIKMTHQKGVIGWKCKVIVSAPQPVAVATAGAAAAGTAKGGKQQQGKDKTPPAEPDYLIRSNTLAGYWELNRRFLRTLASSAKATFSGGSSINSNNNSNAIATRAAGLINEEAVGPAPAISPAAQISPDSLIGEGTRVGEKASIKKCIIGRHCVIGKNAKLTGCVLWDFVTVEENARIENTIICSNGRIGEKSQIKDCEFGTGFEAKPGAILKGERLVAGQEA